MIFPCFSFHLYFFIAIVQNANIRCRDDRAWARVPSPQSAGQLGTAACNLDGQLCKHGPATTLNEVLDNKLCHYGVYFVEFHVITKILLTLRKITKKITKNFQLPKVRKIAKYYQK
jgi:hypothetical protein